jgi:hypothetical protein
MNLMFPKTPSFKSPAWRKSAAGQPCTLRLPGCDGGGETTCLCHIRRFGWAGVAQKPHDFLAVYACHNCHGVIDGREDGPWCYDDLLRALGETLSIHFAEGRKW